MTDQAIQLDDSQGNPAQPYPGLWPPGTFTPPPSQVESERADAPWAEKVPEYLELLSDARALLLMKHHFFGRLAMRMRFEITETVRTAAVRADARCFFNPHFLDQLTVSERAFVIAHELCHLMYGHFDRVTTKIWPLWNAAGDFQINSALIRAGLTPPTRKGLRPLHAKKYDEWSDEEIYWHLEEKTIEEIHAKLGIALWDYEGSGLGTPGGDCDFGATEALRRLFREGLGDRPLTAREWWDAILDAASAAKGRGQFPANLERWVRGIREPQLPWSQILGRSVSTILAPGASWRHPSRRSPSVRTRVMAVSGVPTALPGPERDLDPVVVAMDTSGSMSQGDLEQALGETAAVLRLYRKPIRVLCCDADVHVDTDVRNVAEVRPTGGGGSDTRPVFERLEREPGNWGRPSLLIYFTDLYVAFPEGPPAYPVIWVNTAPAHEPDVPFGTVINLKG